MIGVVGAHGQNPESVKRAWQRITAFGRGRPVSAEATGIYDGKTGINVPRVQAP